MADKLNIALLLGGDSPERSVSFRSGKAVSEALAGGPFNVLIFDVSSDATRAADLSSGHSAAEMLGSRPRHALVSVEWNHLVTALYTGGYDLVFPVTHGGRGENGVLQALLEVAGIPYVGSPSRACAIALDKAVCKAFLRELGVPSPRGILVPTAGGTPDSGVMSGPCVVKPNSSGSSVGVTIFRSPPSREALKDAVRDALVDGAALIEEFIEGVEVTCAVLGENGAAHALPVIEIVPESGGGFYDFEAKYAPGGSRHLSPPRLPYAVQQEVQELALRAHRALGCRDVTRSDFLVAPSGEVYFLEINTLPGLTATSLVPDAARAEGVEFPQLLETLITGALARGATY